MKKFTIEYNAGMSRSYNYGVDYMLVHLPEEMEIENNEIYAEINVENVPGEGHYDENGEWMYDDEWASEPILYEMLADAARELGLTVIACGPDEDVELGRGITIEYIERKEFETIKDEANEIANRIAAADQWEPDDCRRLCELAGMSDEWEAADYETFDFVVYKAADILNVQI